MPTEYQNKLYCLAIIVFLLFGIVIPFWQINPGKTITFNTLYADDCVLGLNTPAEVQITMRLDGVVVGTVNTDEFGIGIYYMMSEGEYTYSYNWQGVAGSQIDIDESLESQTIDIEVATWFMDTDAMFYWSHDMSPIVSSNIDLLFDGEVVATILTTATGRLDQRIYGLTAGDWQFEGATEIFTIVSTEDEIIGGLNIYITPKGNSISLLNQRGINNRF